METIKIMDTVALSSPHLFALLVSSDADKNYNVMGVSWFSFASLKPPKMLFCLGAKGYTGELIKQTKNFTLCLPTQAIKEKAMGCCKTSGRNTNKIDELGFELILPDGFDVPAVIGSKIAWALKLDHTTSAGDHTVYIADIISAAKFSEEKSLYAFEGYRQLKTL